MWNHVLENIFRKRELHCYLYNHKAYDTMIEDIIGENAMEIFELIKKWDNKEYDYISVPECEELFIKHGFYLVK